MYRSRFLPSRFFGQGRGQISILLIFVLTEMTVEEGERIRQRKRSIGEESARRKPFGKQHITSCFTVRSMDGSAWRENLANLSKLSVESLRDHHRIHTGRSTLASDCFECVEHRLGDYRSRQRSIVDSNGNDHLQRRPSSRCKQRL